MFRLISIAFFSFFISYISSNPKTKYLGKIVNENTGVPVSDAFITSVDNKILTQTNSLGYFEVEGDSIELTINHISYQESSVHLTPNSSKVLLKITPRTYSLGTIGEHLLKKPEYDSSSFNSTIINRKEKSTDQSIAEYPGGFKSFENFIMYNSFYMSDSLSGLINSEVYFMINEEGYLKIDSIVDKPFKSQILESIFEKSPRWIPAFQGGNAVKSNYNINLSFDSDELGSIVEVPPTYPSGITAFYKLIGKNLKYPSKARRNGISGKVYVQFVVNKIGELEDIAVLKGIGYGCDEEAVRLIRLSSGNWIPGTQRGKPVKVKMVLPISFRI